MSGFIKTILAAKIPITFFYGDTDAVCNYLLGQKFVEGLGWTEGKSLEDFKFYF